MECYFVSLLRTFEFWPFLKSFIVCLSHNFMNAICFLNFKIKFAYLIIYRLAYMDSRFICMYLDRESECMMIKSQTPLIAGNWIQWTQLGFEPCSSILQPLIFRASLVDPNCPHLPCYYHVSACWFKCLIENF